MSLLHAVCSIRTHPIPSMINYMLPFCTHFPSRYQFNASKVPLCTLGKGKKIPSHQVIDGTIFLMVVLNVCVRVSLQYGKWLISPFWHLGHWCAAWICKKNVHPQLKTSFSPWSKKLQTILVWNWERMHILMPWSKTFATPCCSHLLSVNGKNFRLHNIYNTGQCQRAVATTTTMRLWKEMPWMMHLNWFHPHASSSIQEKKPESYFS